MLANISLEHVTNMISTVYEKQLVSHVSITAAFLVILSPHIVEVYLLMRKLQGIWDFFLYLQIHHEGTLLI